MVNRIDRTFNTLRKKKQKALIPYVSCGYPTLEFTEQLVPLLADSGADLIELGVPYSDPVADGPVIQKASTLALAGGVTLEKIFLLAGHIREKTEVPLIMMTYYNPIYVTGVINFIKKAASVGIDGLIIPDLPLEEAGYLKEVADSNGMNLIFLVAPTSTPGRIKNIADLSRGYIYCVSVTGVTGSRQIIPEGLESLLNRVRLQTQLPLAVGFGVSGPAMAREMAKHADGVIVGSALIEIIEESLQKAHGDNRYALESALSFIRSLREAIN
ncbi:MAG: tryptophan synthase subunit alpha [Bacillota bacterium]